MNDILISVYVIEACAQLQSADHSNMVLVHTGGITL